MTGTDILILHNTAHRFVVTVTVTAPGARGWYSNYNTCAFTGGLERGVREIEFESKSLSFLVVQYRHRNTMRYLILI
jgi:hypothetical protein